MKIALKAGIQSHAMGKRKRERGLLRLRRRLFIDEQKSSRGGGRRCRIKEGKARLNVAVVVTSTLHWLKISDMERQVAMCRKFK